MGIIVQDDFESYPLGSHPSGWIGSPWDVPPSIGTVVAGSPSGTGAQSFQLGELQFTGALQDSVSNRFSINLGGAGSGLASGIGILQGQLGTGGYSVLRVGMNGDATLFVDVLADPFSHTTTFVASSKTALHFLTWYDIILNAIFTTYVLSGVTYIQVQVNLAIDGIEEINILKKTNATLAAVGSVGMTRWIFVPGAISGSFIDDILVQTGGGPISPPVAVAPAKVFQAPLELFQVGNPVAKIFQGAIEILYGSTPPVSPLTLACPINGGQAFLGVFYSAQLVVTTT